MNYYKQIKTELINNEIYKRVKDYSKNRNDLNAYYNVGKLLVEAQGGERRAKYGDNLIKENSLRLTKEVGKGYSTRNLKNMRKFYLLFGKGQVLPAQLNWSHYTQLLGISKKFLKLHIEWYNKEGDKMNIIKPNYEECITNLSNSILKHFNIEIYHNTITFIDEILNKNYKNVIVVLCDGMGSILLDEILDKDSFLIKNRIKTITSVYPPTTTAATTSFLSGLNPNEHGWLGWDLYFKKENKVITMFTNTLKDSEIVAESYSVPRETYPYESITKKISKNYETYELLSFKNEEYKILSNQVDKIIELSKNPNKKFIYAYYENPDSLLHECGINSEIVKEEFKNINDNLEYLCNKLEDSVVIITADHGHIDSKYYNLDNYPSIKGLLERTTSIEPRAISFKVFDNKKEEFESEFNKYFKNEFWLLNKEEVIDSKIFGTGDNSIHFEDAIGDYVALAKSDKCIIYSDDTMIFKSMHAGLTDREMLIPIIVKEKVKVKGQ